MRRLASLLASRSWVRGCALSIVQIPSPTSPKPAAKASYPLPTGEGLFSSLNPHQQRLDLHLRASLGIQLRYHPVERRGQRVLHFHRF
jgi:hypothetical protein